MFLAFMSLKKFFYYLFIVIEPLGLPTWVVVVVLCQAVQNMLCKFLIVELDLGNRLD